MIKLSPSRALVKSQLTRSLVDLMADLKLIDVGWERRGPHYVLNGTRATMALKIHGLLDAIEQRKCTR